MALQLTFLLFGNGANPKHAVQLTIDKQFSGIMHLDAGARKLLKVHFKN
jgi:hypothetical protein